MHTYEFLEGVAYQLTSDDPLITTKQCPLEARLMKDLGANTISVYHVDPTGDHSGCMSAFSDAGIYLFVDLDTTTTNITEVRIDGIIDYERLRLIKDCFCSLNQNGHNHSFQLLRQY